MEDEVLLTRCINLLEEVCTLLGQTVVATELWNDTSMACKRPCKLLLHTDGHQRGYYFMSFLAEIILCETL